MASEESKELAQGSYEQRAADNVIFISTGHYLQCQAIGKTVKKSLTKSFFILMILNVLHMNDKNKMRINRKLFENSVCQ